MNRMYFEPAGYKSLVYSEHVFKNALSAVKRPAGFLKDWPVFIFGKNSVTQICDSNSIVSASLKCKSKDYMIGKNWGSEFTVLFLSSAIHKLLNSVSKWATIRRPGLNLTLFFAKPLIELHKTP